MDAIFLGVLFATLIVLILFLQCRRPGNLPPGPKGLPLIGYIPFLKNHDPRPYKAMIKLSQIYGPVTGYYVGPSQFFVSVCGYEAVREALNNQDLDGRPDSAARRERNFGKRLGLMFVDGDFYREQRRFAVRHLRDLGFGRTSMEDLIHEEIRDLMAEISEQAVSNPNNVVDFKGIFNLSILNVLWALIGGERFDRNDTRLAQLLEMVELFARSFKPLTAAISVPGFLLRLFPSLRTLMGLRNDIFQPMHDFIRATIEKHANNPSEDDSPRDFIDIYLKEMEKQQAGNPYTSFHVEQLICSIVDLFLAGSETTSNNIGFALLYLIHHPNVMQKMQAELDQICGDGLPSFADRENLPYTEAVLTECLRISNITPLTISHCAIKDTKLSGHTIPKGSLVMMNLYSINMDETYWTNPEVFSPERHLHLDADGLKLVKSEHILPFGAGKRMCLGAPLARNTFYLFTTALVKAFHLEVVPNCLPPTLEPLSGITNGFQGFQAVVKPRL